MTFLFPPKVDLARIPTPIERMSRLSDEWGIDLYVKRDDLTGSELSGNKVRKLDYLLRDALDKGCDVVVTCGAVTSNHARATALAARKMGLDSVLVLAGKKPDLPIGNLQLDLLAGAEVRYISWEEYGPVIDEYIGQVGEELTQQGRRPYVIPTGGSNALGLAGYAEAAKEILWQCEALNWQPEYIVCAVGSGGTYAGLFLGNALFSCTRNVLGMLVCASIGHFQSKIERDILEAKARFGWDVPIDFASIQLCADYIADGYAKTTPDQMKLILHIAQVEGIILEPVYTGKAFYGLFDWVRTGEIPPNSKVLFIHTGGIFGLADYAQVMLNQWDRLDRWQENQEVGMRDAVSKG